MKKLYTLLGMVGLIAFSTTSKAQCANDNVQFGTTSAPTVVGQTATLTTCIFGGEYRLMTNMQAGATYRFETCGDTDFDTQISVYNNGNGALVDYNDDACGLQSIVEFVSDGSDVRISVDRFFCSNQSTCMTLLATLISAPSTSSPCDNITALSGCDVSSNFLLSGTGAFNGNGPWNTPGEEAIYSYTPPFTGDYEIGVSHTGGSYVDLFFRTAASGCSGTNWTYVDDILGSATNTVNLIGGTTYYFMVDDENTSASNGTLTIECPCIPTTVPDGSFTYNGPFTISGNTTDACSDCNLRPSEDQIFEIEILCAGSYTFETCNGATFDTYLYLTDAFCGNVIAFNDDSPCGGGFSLQSSITAQLSPGTYYVSVEAFSVFSSGAFDLAVSGALDPINIAITSTTDVTCFGDSDGSATAQAQSGTMPFNYVWSDGQTTATASGLAAGTYLVGGTDANGCVANDATATINQPDQIEANMSPQNHIIDCIPIPVDLSANPTGGTGGPYTYLWSTGETTASITVNPNVTTTYAVSITDANGCTENINTNSTTVTVLNRCGNNNQKSLICHVPNGNGGNPQTICISPNALNAHLSTLLDLHGGDYCGPCSSNIGSITTDNTDLGDNSFIRAAMNASDESVDVSYRLSYDTEIRIEIYDMAGVLVDVIYEGQASEGEFYDLKLHTDKVSSGVYIYQFITNRETHIDKLQIIQE